MSGNSTKFIFNGYILIALFFTVLFDLNTSTRSSSMLRNCLYIPDWSSRPTNLISEGKIWLSQVTMLSECPSKPPRSSIFTRCLNSCSGSYFDIAQPGPRLHPVQCHADKRGDWALHCAGQSRRWHLPRVQSMAQCRLCHPVVVAVPGVGCCMLLCAVYGNTGLDSVPVPAQPSPAQPSPTSPASTMWPPGHREQCTPLCN